jgi:hypothetical protein
MRESNHSLREKSIAYNVARHVRSAKVSLQDAGLHLAEASCATHDSRAAQRLATLSRGATLAAETVGAIAHAVIRQLRSIGQ